MTTGVFETLDRQQIHELIQNCVIWRDGGDRERFATVWHEEGRMNATWFQGPVLDSIEANKQGWRKGVRIFHSLGEHPSKYTATVRSHKPKPPFRSEHTLTAWSATSCALAASMTS